jgi:hypothetical protein
MLGMADERTEECPRGCQTVITVEVLSTRLNQAETTSG